MRRLLIALALVAAACGGSTAPTPDPAGDAAPAATSSSTAQPSAASSSQAATTAPEAGGSTTATSADAPVVERVRPEGRDAPDFTLALGQGGEFMLSAEQKPVYMVFWAEW